MTADQLKQLILNIEADEFVETYILNTESQFFSQDKLSYVARRLSAQYSIEITSDHLCITGSAKTGFGLFRKKTRTGQVLLPFRPFGPNSDIDIAVFHPDLFSILWNELSYYANKQYYMPWNSEKLGDYLIYGWLRPDHFPMGSIYLKRCYLWWELFNNLSANSALGKREIRGGLYYSKEQFKYYQSRGIQNCRRDLEI